MTSYAATLDRSSFLRRVLHVDAATCLGMGALLTHDAVPLAGLLGLPGALLYWAGMSLFPIGALMFLISTRRPIPAAGAWLVVAGNTGWVLASIAVLVEFSPTGLGCAFVIAQAVVVALLAELEYTGLRKAAA